MPKAHMLPSGSWNVIVYAGKDNAGKRKYESFTAPTRREAELQAAQWSLRRSVRPEDLSVSEAVDRYIQTNEQVFSPSTAKKYRSLASCHFGEIAPIPLRRLTSAQAQAWVSSLAKTLSPKSVSCAYGLLTATLSQLAPDLSLHVRLPRRIPKEIRIPTPDEVDLLIREAPDDFKAVLVIASTMGLRRGEIAALRWSDVQGNALSVTRAYVQGPDKLWTVHAPKTNAGIRLIPVPPPAVPYLTPPEGADPDAEIVPYSPDAIPRRFERLTARLRLPYHFHALRHYYDSVLLSLGVPEKYIMARMGHATPSMSRQVYAHIMQDRDAQITDQINEYFKQKSATQNEMQNEKAET